MNYLNGCLKFCCKYKRLRRSGGKVGLGGRAGVGIKRRTGDEGRRIGRKNKNRGERRTRRIEF